MRYFETFAGVGGFSLGIEYALRSIQQPVSERSAEHNDAKDKLGEWQCVGFSEVDKYASAVLAHHYPSTKNYGDIKTIDWSTVPNFDLLVGGSPCQDLSIAGKRAGLDGERSGLFFHYIRALKEKQPAYFIWENVKGTLSSNEGRDFAEVQNHMAEAGYSIWWQVLNAKDFGVPQNRERIFVVGTRNGSPREVLFEAGNRRQDSVESDSASIYKQTKRLSDSFRIRDTDGVSATLKGLGGGMGAKTGLYAMRRCPLRFLERNQKNIEGDYAFTVDASQTAGVTDGHNVRRLTELECERLMGWPDGHTKYGRFGDEVKEISGTQRYKMCGNGVVANVVEAIVKEHLL